MLLYKSIICPHVAFANSVWCLYKIDDLKEIEKIQKRATKLLIKLKNKSYTDRLIYLNMSTLKYRCFWGDLIEVFKITHNIYDTTVYNLVFLSVKELTPEATTINCKSL